MVMAVAKAKEEGNDTVICASTGNTSAAAAAMQQEQDEMYCCHSRWKNCHGQAGSGSHVRGRNYLY